MAEFIAAHVIEPALPGVQVKKVKTKEGRRFEAPRILWNVFEAQLELPGGGEAQPLFWTKAFFNDDDCEDYRQRVERLLTSSNDDPLHGKGYARFFPDLNLFLFFFPTDPVFPTLPRVTDGGRVQSILEPHIDHLRHGATPRSVTATRRSATSSPLAAGTRRPSSRATSARSRGCGPC